MLSLRTIGNEDVAHLQQAFNGFWFWAAIRSINASPRFCGEHLVAGEIFEFFRIRKSVKISSAEVAFTVHAKAMQSAWS